MTRVRAPVPSRHGVRSNRQKSKYFREERTGFATKPRGFNVWRGDRARRRDQARQPTPGTACIPDPNDSLQVLPGIPDEAHLHKKRSGQKYPEESYTPGTIFAAPHYSQARDDYWESGHPLVTASSCGPVYSKNRRFVVIETYADHVICLPIYSHNRRGLDFVRSSIEWVSIRDIKDSKQEPAESPHGLVLCQTLPGNGHILVAKGRSSVHLTEPTTHRYSDYATIQGSLLSGEQDKLTSMMEKVKLLQSARAKAKAAMEIRYYARILASMKNPGLFKRAQNERQVPSSSSTDEEDGTEEGEIYE